MTKINGYKILIVKEGFDEEYLCSDGSVLSKLYFLQLTVNILGQLTDR